MKLQAMHPWRRMDLLVFNFYEEGRDYEIWIGVFG